MAAPTEPAFEFTEEQNQTLAGLASGMKLLSLAILALAALRVASGVVEIMTTSWAGIWYIIEGLVTVLAGLVMLSASTDTRFIVDTTGYDKPHLLNAFSGLKVFYKIQIGLAVFVGVITALRLFV